MPNYVVIFTVLDATKEKEYLQQHIDYFNELRALGHVIGNGKLEDDAEGLAIFKATSKVEVNSLLQRDPFVAFQIRKVDIKQWNAKWAQHIITELEHPPGHSKPVIKDLAATELKSRMEHGERPFIVDVREDNEVATGIIPGSYHIRLGDLAERYKELPKDKEILFVCRGGKRSRIACELMQDKNYKRLVNLSGGMTAWNGLL